MPNLPRFYPTFTSPPVFTLSSVLPKFYPVPSILHTPIPHFYPRGKTAHFLLVALAREFAVMNMGGNDGIKLGKPQGCICTGIVYGEHAVL